MPRPFRFLADAREVASIRELTETARRAEAIGIDTLVVPDHLIPQLAPIADDGGHRRGLGSAPDRAFVLNNDLRHPAVLAQELASLDVLSEGRLDVAIGAGWNRAEYEAIGLPFDPTPVRQARLAEAVRCSRVASPTDRSASPASTTRSPTTTPSRSRSSGRIRRSSSAAAGGGR